MTYTQDLISRLRSAARHDSMFGDDVREHASEQAADALEAAQAEIERLNADRRVLQADGKHPAPCAKFCEATAFTIELRRAKAERDQALARLAEIEAGASPEPSALQAENAKLITALAECRDAFPVPDAGSDLDGWYVGAIADPLAVPAYVKACLAGQPSQATDLRGIDAGPLSEWVDLVRRGYVSKDECLIAVKDVHKFVAKNQPSQAGEPFPARIMELLIDVADRKGSEFKGPWEDGNGEPLQDDADAAIAWIAAINAKGAK